MSIVPRVVSVRSLPAGGWGSPKAPAIYRAEYSTTRGAWVWRLEEKALRGRFRDKRHQYRELGVYGAQKAARWADEEAEKRGLRVLAGARHNDKLTPKQVALLGLS
jgi:plasmid stabilization system protein ParE